MIVLAFTKSSNYHNDLLDSFVYERRLTDSNLLITSDNVLPFREHYFYYFCFAMTVGDFNTPATKRPDCRRSRLHRIVVKKKSPLYYITLNITPYRRQERKRCVTQCNYQLREKEPPTHVPIMPGVPSLLSRMNSNRYVMVTSVL